MVLLLQVWLGSWRGKRVAVKVMHLQNNTLLGSSDQSGCHSQDEANGQQEQQGPEQQEQLQRLQRQRQQNSPPHMAVMEAVVSSAMSHPNVSLSRVGTAMPAAAAARLLGSVFPACGLCHSPQHSGVLCSAMSGCAQPQLRAASLSCLQPGTACCLSYCSVAAQVVQVYTYMLTPLMVQAGHTTAGGELQQTAATPVAGPGKNGHSSGLFGYSLKLVMEWCEKVCRQHATGPQTSALFWRFCLC